MDKSLSLYTGRVEREQITEAGLFGGSANTHGEVCGVVRACSGNLGGGSGKQKKRTRPLKQGNAPSRLTAEKEIVARLYPKDQEMAAHTERGMETNRKAWTTGSTLKIGSSKRDGGCSGGERSGQEVTSGKGKR